MNRQFLSDAGVGQVTDCMVPRAACKHGDKDGFLPWLIRKIEVVRGEVTFRMECAPAFDYARSVGCRAQRSRGAEEQLRY